MSLVHTTEPGNGRLPALPSSAPPVGGLPMLATYVELIREIADSDFVPDTMRRKPGAILACFMKGYELGLGPMQALDSIDIIKGKPGLKPEGMRALINQEGHSIRHVEYTETAVTLRVHRKEWADGDYEDFRWTMDDAKRADLTSNPSWKKYPRAMLEARCTSEAARAVFADVIKGLSYTPEEIESFTPAASTVAPAEKRAEVLHETAGALGPGGDPAWDAPVELPALATDEQRSELRARVDAVREAAPEVARDLAQAWRANGVTAMSAPDRFTVNDFEVASALVTAAEGRLAQPAADGDPDAPGDARDEDEPQLGV